MKELASCSLARDAGPSTGAPNWAREENTSVLRSDRKWRTLLRPGGAESREPSGPGAISFRKVLTPRHLTGPQLYLLAPRRSEARFARRQAARPPDRGPINSCRQPSCDLESSAEIGLRAEGAPYHYGIYTVRRGDAVNV